jgi:hypothetical protein
MNSRKYLHYFSEVPNRIKMSNIIYELTNLNIQIYIVVKIIL